MSSVKVEVIIDRELFYNEESNFGIYSATPKNEEEALKVKLNAYGNIAIKGVVPRLEIGGNYTVKAVEKMDKRYGLGYDVESVFQEIPNSIEDQRSYLSTILTPLQVASIYEVYEGQDVIQLFRDNTFDYKKVKGFGETVYNNVKKRVIDNIELQEALVNLSKYGLTYNMVAKLVSKYGSASIVVEKIEENPYVLTEVDGIGFIKCDEYALKMGVEKDSEERVIACIKYILDEEANNGHSWVSIKSMLNKSSELLDISKKIVEGVIETLDEKSYYFDGNKIAKINLYMYESMINDHIQRILNSNKIEIKDIEDRINKAEEKQGFKYTDEQRSVLELVCKENIVVVSGRAGSGKTSILKGVKDLIDGYSMHGCALSGKASQRMIEGAEIQASTIHRMLGVNKDEFGFLHNESNPLPYNIIVLDEASMVNSYIFYSLICAIGDTSKLIIVGDIEQLEPIGAGNILKDIIESGVVPTVTLTKVHRQAMKSGILSTANEIREGKQFNSSDDYENRVIGELKDLHFKPFVKSESVFNAIIKSCKQYSQKKNIDIMNFQVIVPLKNKGNISTKNLNIELQKIFNPDLKPTIKRGLYEFKEGDKIIQSGNNYDEGVFNGTLGIIDRIDTSRKTMIINFIGVGEVEYNQEKLSQIDMAYALTIHKTQGSAFENVIIGLDYSAYVMLSRQLVYTAITRASKLCILSCENKALRHAIKTNKSSKRNTFLKEMLAK
jgi:exodeoxyribonuclease V alpha subunit